MIEVFKTNVCDNWMAGVVVDVIHRLHRDYKANFDLDDRDRILRIQSATGEVPPGPVISLLSHFGITAEVLPD